MWRYGGDGDGSGRGRQGLGSAIQYDDDDDFTVTTVLCDGVFDCAHADALLLKFIVATIDHEIASLYVT